MPRQKFNKFKYTEVELAARVSSFLTRKGYRVRSEVPTLGQSADLVATKNRWVTIVEVKTKDWRTALQQCRAHEIVADFIFVAVGSSTLSTQLVQAAERRGYGVIHCPLDGDCYFGVSPKRNPFVWMPQRRYLSKTIRAIAHES